ncbi:MAG: tetraacyldisaccharide 4'-kinase [Elusimicrobiota bacterium]
MLKTALSPLLFVFSCIYRLGLIFFISTVKTNTVTVPVVSFGNITTGGTGKTPAVMKLIESIDNRKKTALLTRGYGRTSSGMYIGDIASTARQIGDEAVTVKRRYPDVMIIAGKDRSKSAEEGIKRGAEVLIMDDGFQSRELNRNMDIVLIDCTAPFGNRQLIPLGMLREPLSSLARADKVILTRSDMVKEDEVEDIKKTVKKYNPYADILHAVESIREVSMISGQGKYPAEVLNGKELISFCAIGNPGGFYRLVDQAGGRIVRKIEKRDHYKWKRSDLEKISDEAYNEKAELITTEKDAARFAGVHKIEGWILKMDIMIRESDKWEDIVNEI